MYGIYTNIGGILMGFMLPYIAAPWILWEYVPIKIHGKLQDPFHLRPLTERHSAAPMCLISKLQWVVNQHCPFRLRTGCDRTGLGSQSRKPSCRFWGDENLTGSVWLGSFKVQFPYVCATRLGASRGGSMVESNSWRYVPYIYIYWWKFELPPLLPWNIIPLTIIDHD